MSQTTACSETALRAAIQALMTATRGDGSGTDEADKARRKQIYDVLAEECRSDAHLEAVAAALVKACRYFPTVSEVLSFIADTPPPLGIGGAKTNCPECNGDGWKRTQIFSRGMRYDAVKVCPCRRGQ